MVDIAEGIRTGTWDDMEAVWARIGCTGRSGRDRDIQVLSTRPIRAGGVDSSVVAGTLQGCLRISGDAAGCVHHIGTGWDAPGMPPDQSDEVHRDVSSTTSGSTRDALGTRLGRICLTRTCEDAVGMSAGPTDTWGRRWDAFATPGPARTSWGCLRIHGDDVGTHPPH